jgi:hypothetical protein
MTSVEKDQELYSFLSENNVNLEQFLSEYKKQKHSFTCENISDQLIKEVKCNFRLSERVKRRQFKRKLRSVSKRLVKKITKLNSKRDFTNAKSVVSDQSDEEQQQQQSSNSSSSSSSNSQNEKRENVEEDTVSLLSAGEQGNLEDLCENLKLKDLFTEQDLCELERQLREIEESEQQQQQQQQQTGQGACVKRVHFSETPGTGRYSKMLSFQKHQKQQQQGLGIGHKNIKWSNTGSEVTSVKMDSNSEGSVYYSDISDAEITDSENDAEIAAAAVAGMDIDD